jgi:hypothetical protein
MDPIRQVHSFPPKLQTLNMNSYNISSSSPLPLAPNSPKLPQLPSIRSNHSTTLRLTNAYIFTEGLFCRTVLMTEESFCLIHNYLIVAKFAKDHLAIPPMSAPSESVFSICGDVVTKKRNRLTGDTVRIIVCLKA